MLIILPGHLQVSGVTTWAIRAIKGLRERSIQAGIIVHCGQGESIPEFLLPYVVGVVEDAPSMDSLSGCVDTLVPVYLDAIKRMNSITKKPVIVSPNLHGDCYGAIAAIARDHPKLIRVAAWIHSDNAYDIAVCAHYQQMIHSIVPVSSELGVKASRSLPDRSADVIHIPHGVDVSAKLSKRPSLKNRPIRLLYTGRVEEYQKRISTLPLLCEQLENSGVQHELRIVGDGPAMPQLIEQSHGRVSIDLLGSIPPDQINEHLQWADVWVLPSRFEGQSIAMLEAMAMGCVPMITRVQSGALDAVIQMQSGICIDAGWDTPTDHIAVDMCNAIESLSEEQIKSLSIGAHRIALRHHRTSVHIDAMVALIEKLEQMPDRPWPRDKRAAYTAPPGELSGSTPHDAAARMRECLESLQGKSVLIFGSGQHTKDLASTIENTGIHIAGIIDDNLVLAGNTILGSRIYEPHMIKHLGATELIISSYIHQESIWKNRATLEAQGVRVHRLYPVDDLADDTDDVSIC